MEQSLDDGLCDENSGGVLRDLGSKRSQDSRKAGGLIGSGAQQREKERRVTGPDYALSDSGLVKRPTTFIGRMDQLFRNQCRPLRPIRCVPNDKIPHIGMVRIKIDYARNRVAKSVMNRTAMLASALVV